MAMASSFSGDFMMSICESTNMPLIPRDLPFLRVRVNNPQSSNDIGDAAHPVITPR